MPLQNVDGYGAAQLAQLQNVDGYYGAAQLAQLQSVNCYAAAQLAQYQTFANNNALNQDSCNVGATESSHPPPLEELESSSDEGSGPSRYEGSRRVRRGPAARPEQQVAVEREKLVKSAALSAELAKLRIDAASLELRNSLLERMVLQLGTAPSREGGLSVEIGKSGGIWMAGDPKKKLVMWVGVGWTLDQPVRMSVLPGQVQMSLEDMGKMALSQFMSLWKQYVNAFAILLNDAPDDYSADSLISRQCKGLMDEVAAISFCYITYSSKNDTPDLHQLRMDTMTGSPDERPPAEMWCRIVAACKLTEKQRVNITGARRTYLAKLRDIMIERQTIVVALQTNPPTGTGEPFVMGRTIPARLHSSLQAESELGDWYICTIGYNIMSPVQCAVMMVQAYPWVPNLIAIGNVVAEQMGEPGTLQLLGPPASASAAAASATAAAAAGSRPGFNQPGPALAGRAMGGAATGSGAGVAGESVDRLAVAAWAECE